MKLITRVEFVDKYTREIHKIGDIFSVNETRANELILDKRHLVDHIEESKQLVEDTVEKPKPKRRSKAKE